MRVEDYSFFDIEVGEDGVALATMNRPDKQNAFDERERDQVHQLPKDVATDDAIRALVLTGAGEWFSRGADHATDTFDSFRYYERTRDFFSAYMGLDKPVLAAMNGPARGLGLTLALVCDFVILARGVGISDSHVKGGIVSATGPFLWPLATGTRAAKRWLMTGDEISSEEAERIGLVTEVVDPGKTVERAMTYARQMASYPPDGVMCTKRNINQWLQLGMNPVFENGLALEFMSFPTARRVEYGGGR